MKKRKGGDNKAHQLLKHYMAIATESLVVAHSYTDGLMKQKKIKKKNPNTQGFSIIT